MVTEISRLGPNLFGLNPEFTRDDLVELVRGIRDQVREDMQVACEGVETRVVEKLKELLPDLVKQAIQEVDVQGMVSQEVCNYDFPSMIVGIVDKMVEDRVSGLELLLYEIQETAYQKAMESFSLIIAALPQPVVQVPEALPPVINVESPIVHVPETIMPAPVVNIPEFKQLPPVVNVSVPKRKVTKHIAYDEFQRPSVITESEE